MLLRFFVLVSLSMFLAACMATNPYAPVPKELALKIRVYEDVVRWGDLHKMHAFVKDKSSNMPTNLDNIRVTHYEASEITELAPWRWGQTAVISYVIKDRQTVKKLSDQQVWESDNEGKSWYRANPIPNF